METLLDASTVLMTLGERPSETNASLSIARLSAEHCLDLSKGCLVSAVAVMVVPPSCLSDQKTRVSLVSMDLALSLLLLLTLSFGSPFLGGERAGISKTAIYVPEHLYPWTGVCFPGEVFWSF